MLWLSSSFGLSHRKRAHYSAIMLFCIKTHECCKCLRRGFNSAVGGVTNSGFRHLSAHIHVKDLT